MMIQDYLKYTSNSESPESYHTWVALSMVSALVGKKVWVKFNYFNVWPNMYIALVSLPGVGKKSTAIRIGRQMVHDAEAPVKMIADNITREALIMEMEEAKTVFDTPSGNKYISSSLTALASELVTLLAGGPTMVEFLTDIYDSDKQWKYKTKNKGENLIINPCLNVISGVTTDIFCSRIIKDAVSGGFISRSVIVYDQDVRVSSPFELPSQAQLIAKEKVIARFRQIADMFGEITFTPDAKRIFEEWYFAEKAAMQAGASHMEFHSRKHIHVVKCAMMLAVSELKLVIGEFEINAAIQLLRRIEHNMKFIYMSAGASKYSDMYLRLLSAVNVGKQIKYVELLKFFMKDMDNEEFDKLLSMMERLKYVKRMKDKDKEEWVIITDEGKRIFDKYDTGAIPG
jgi:hypothetical protein